MNSSYYVFLLHPPYYPGSLLPRPPEIVPRWPATALSATAPLRVVRLPFALGRLDLTWGDGVHGSVVIGPWSTNEGLSRGPGDIGSLGKEGLLGKI